MDSSAPQLEPDKASYLARVCEDLEQRNEDTDVELIADAVLEELASGQTCIAACVHREGSSTLERLIKLLPQSHVHRIFSELTGGAWTWLLCNPYASHVFDACIRSISDNQDRSGVSVMAEVSTKLVNEADWPALAQSNYACQSLKHLLRALNGQTDAKLEKMRRKVSNSIVQGCDCIQMSQLPFGSSLLQFILQEEAHAVKASYAQEAPCWKALYSLFSSAADDWDRACKNQAQSRLIEEIVAIAAANPDSTAPLATIYSNLFRGKLAHLCAHPVANFVVQRLIDGCSTGPLASLLFAELKESIAQLFRGRAGVIAKLAKKAAQFPDIQRDFVRSLAKGLLLFQTVVPTADTASDEKALAEVRSKLTPTLLRFKNAPKHTFKQRRHRDDQEQQFSPLGCGILECLVAFQYDLVKFVAKSFVELDVEKDIVPMAKDNSASRVLEQFLLSPSITVKLKQQLIEKLRGRYGELALNQAASHVVEKCYAAAELSRKEVIASELSAVEPQLSNLRHGKFVLQTCRVLQYKQKKDDWLAAEEGVQKKKALFDDILNDDAVPPPAPTPAKEKQSSKQTSTPRAADPTLSVLGFGKHESKKRKGGDSDVEPAAKRQKTEDTESNIALSSTLMQAISGSKDAKKDKKNKKDKKDKKKKDKKHE
eukprot:TRINITY_DN340_c0_g1_i2.p1 TRINITY_DN340_c0_g1~~TRINITY_DN340_c0_g1_i2.p1  ORF type:complete len:655 (-),score=111.48 TRINITY_DN340_c0_g1_i2:52-2016(-)